MAKTSYDVIIVGAGPCGLAAGIAAKEQGLRYLIIDKGNVTESIRRYPVDMVFFSTSEMIEIGNIPFVSQGIRPNRTEALKYYRKVVSHYELELSLFTELQGVEKSGEDFLLTTSKGELKTRKLVLATGYYDKPKKINVPGEDLPHVSHYYDEAYKYTYTDVVVVGGANSAIEAALDLYRSGAKVTLVHQFDELDQRAKYWIVPDLKNRINKAEVAAHFNSRVLEIEDKQVRIEGPEGEKVLKADFVLLMTGYRPDKVLLERIGIELEGEAFIPKLDLNSFESNLEGVYMVGSVVGGEETAKIFIENGRHHGKVAIDHLSKRLSAQKA